MRAPIKLNLQVHKVTDNSAAVFKGIAALHETDVLVGVPEEKTERKDGDEISNAALAYIHDKGMPSMNIPARPFMDPGIENARDRIEEGLRAAGDSALDGNSDGVISNLTAVGLVASTSIKSKINTGPFVPLKPATLRAFVTETKRRRDYGTRPLTVTAQMRNAVTFVLRRAK